MAEVLSPSAITMSPSQNSSDSPASSTDELSALPPQPLDRIPSYAQNRMSQYSRSSQQRSRPQSTALEYPAFPSSLTYAQVRDFAYPIFHPLHYGAQLEPSGASTPGSDSQWNAMRRQSDPMEQWNGNTSAQTGGWSAGPWGGDGVMYGDPQQDSSLTSLPSTSFAGSEGEDGVPPLDFGSDELMFKKGKHRKSRSYANMSEFERGRRRESGRRSRAGEDGMFFFHGQQPGQSQEMQGVESNGGRRDSRYAATLPSRSFHHSQSSNNENLDPDEQIPLDSEPHTHSPVRNSMGPEDEELFAGPSLALYSFEPENSNELRLVEGQEIMVSYRHGQGWLVASDPRTGEQGLVPEAYVRLIADMPNYDPETGEFVDVDEDEDMNEHESSGAVGIPQDSETEGWRREIQQHQHEAMDEDGAEEDEGHVPNARESDEFDEESLMVGADATSQR